MSSFLNFSFILVLHVPLLLTSYSTMPNGRSIRELWFYRDDNGEFEALDLEPYSTPPDLPYVMKSADSGDGGN